jgi:OmpA-OmpF porin, OOP family
MMKIILAALSLSICMSASSAAVRKDHPLLSGIPGYKIDEDVQVTQFGTMEKGSFGNFVCNAAKPCDDTVPGFKGGKLIAEGKVTKIVYRNDKAPIGPLAIQRNYENAIASIGGRKLSGTDIAPLGTHLFFVEKDGARTWISLDNSDNLVILTFLEEKKMSQVVTAGQLADSIAKQGFATLYINFDTNKADIKPDDKPALSEVATMLSKDKSMHISIEGHTDNVGNAAANKSLSEKRAQSVMAALVAGGIDVKRLQAKGFGSEVPVADNRADEGKAKNRRVELVKVK